jgi:DNA-binding response OmpR family regulator
MTVHCNGKSITLDGQKHRRFKLLQLLLAQPGVALSHQLLCASGNPWMENKSHKISVSAIKSIVRELKKDLKPLGLLPVIIKTQSFEGELRPLLKQK